MTVPKIVVHTDVFLEHLCSDRKVSLLRHALGKFFCYATVFQAIELFSLARSEAEVRAIEASMAAMKVLGLNPRNARKYGGLLARRRESDVLATLVAGMCLESGLPLLTGRHKEFSKIPGLLVVPAASVEVKGTGAEILKAARARK